MYIHIYTYIYVYIHIYTYICLYIPYHKYKRCALVLAPVSLLRGAPPPGVVTKRKTSTRPSVRRSADQRPPNNDDFELQLTAKKINGETIHLQTPARFFLRLPEKQKASFICAQYSTLLQTFLFELERRPFLAYSARFSPFSHGAKIISIVIDY